MAATIVTPEVNPRNVAEFQQRLITQKANLADLEQMLVLAKRIDGRKK